MSFFLYYIKTEGLTHPVMLRQKVSMVHKRTSIVKKGDVTTSRNILWATLLGLTAASGGRLSSQVAMAL
jgi:hypothetical protein